MAIFTLIFILFLSIGTFAQLWLKARHIIYIQDHQQVVPDAFIDKISLIEHQKAASYTIAKVRFGQIMLLTEMVLLLFWTLGGGLNFIDQYWRVLAWSNLWTGVAVIMSVMLISSFIDLPSNIYNTFYLEERFGFNKMTPGLFISDLFKSILLTFLIGIPLIFIVLWLMESMGQYWWIDVWAVWMGFSLLTIWAYPAFIAPLFNKFSPLENQELKQRIEALLQRNGFTSQGIFIMDGSKRSGHGNAYFTGFGNNKRIVFFDTLLAGLTVDEIEAVLAHEVGHFKHKHIVKRMIWMALLTFASLALLGWLMQQSWFYSGLGVRSHSTYMALLLFTLCLPVFTFFLQPIMAWASRRHEFEADDFAAQQANPQHLIHALVKLYKENANTLTPEPLHSSFYDSHPPAPVRIAHLSAKLATN